MVIYEIRHRDGSRYLAQCKSLHFFGKWDQEIENLNSGNHSCATFQKLWNSSIISDWQFKVRRIVPNSPSTNTIRKRAAFLQYEYNVLRSKNCLINDSKEVDFLDREDLIFDRVKSAVGYKDICREFDCSMGTISKIKKKLRKRSCFYVQRE